MPSKAQQLAQSLSAIVNTANVVSTGANNISMNSATGIIDASMSYGSFNIPQGTYNQRPVAAANGAIRYNTSNNQTEIYSGLLWTTLTSQTYTAQYLIVGGGGGGGGGGFYYANGGDGDGDNRPPFQGDDSRALKNNMKYAALARAAKSSPFKVDSAKEEAELREAISASMKSAPHGQGNSGGGVGRGRGGGGGWAGECLDGGERQR